MFGRTKSWVLGRLRRSGETPFPRLRASTLAGVSRGKQHAPNHHRKNAAFREQ
jgi:hypothetical protein